MKKVLAIFVLSVIGSFAYSQGCNPPAAQCGPLYGNSGGTSFCCGNTDQSCCYAGACGGTMQ